VLAVSRVESIEHWSGIRLSVFMSSNPPLCSVICPVLKLIHQEAAQVNVVAYINAGMHSK